MKRSTALQRRSPLRRRSKRTEARDRRYTRERLEFLAERPLCQIGWDDGCTGAATSVHHRRGRGRFMLDRSTWVACCHPCHMAAHANPVEAYRRGVSVHRNQEGAA